MRRPFNWKKIWK